MAIISFSRILGKWAERQPHKPAVILGDEQVTWRDLDRRTNQLARTYRALGVKQDDFVTIALPNSIEFIECIFAVWKLGATPQPISPILPAIEREAITELARPSLVVGIDSQDPGYASLPSDFEIDTEQSDAPLEELTSKHVKAVTSGGSTGRPKLIVMPSPAVWDEDYTYINVPHESVVYVPGPLYHNGPLMWTVCGLCQGNTLVLSQKFDAEQTLDVVSRHKVEHMYIVPTMMQRIWALPEETKAQYDISCLGSICHTAAPCPRWLKEEFIDWLGPDKVWELYGGSEGQGSTLIGGEEWLLHKGSVGKAMPGCQIRVVDENGQDMSPGEVGEVYMRPETGQGSTYQYIGAETTSLDDGWDSIGDMGYLDGDGYLYLADRRTDLILSGGANIYPAEVEAAIDSYPGVRSSAVIGLPHEDLGNTVHAIIDAPGNTIQSEEMLEHLALRLVKYKLPRSIEFVEEPLRDDAGKVRRKALREARVGENQ